MSRRVSLPTIALVGRTNVGKSTLFNRLLEEERALVSPLPGTTRDRNYGMTHWRGVAVQVIDTGGLDIAEAEELERDVRRQARLAIKEADCLLFVVDLKTGRLPQDRALAAELAGSPKPVLLVGNKADSPALRLRAHDLSWQALRLGEVKPVSAANGSGVGDLLDLVLEKIGRPPDPQGGPETRIAVIGRPNVGKSSLVNALAGEERVIVSPIPGTTREPQDTLIEVGGRRYLLVDTVGLRRRRQKWGFEEQGIKRTERAIERAPVLLLVLDSNAEITAADRVLAGEVVESGKALVLVMNKWDAVSPKSPGKMRDLEKNLKRTLPSLDFAAVRFTSARTGQGVDALLSEAERALEKWQTWFPDRLLDGFLRKTLAQMPKTGRPFVYRIKQTSNEPPTFLLSVRGKKPPPEAFLRYLENRLRQTFDLSGTPVRIRAKNVQIRP